MCSTSVDILIRDAFHPYSIFSSGYPALDTALPDGGLVVGRVTEISCLTAEVPYRAWLLRLIASFVGAKDGVKAPHETDSGSDHRRVVLFLTRGAREWPLRELFADLQSRGVAVGPNTVEVIFVPTITALSLAITDLLSHLRGGAGTFSQNDAGKSCAPSSPAPRLLVVVDHMLDLLLSDSVQYPSGNSLGPSYVVTELGRQLHQLCSFRVPVTPMVATNHQLGADAATSSTSSSSTGASPCVSVVVVTAQQGGGNFFPRPSSTNAGGTASTLSLPSSSWLPTDHRPYGPQAWRSVADQVLLVGEMPTQPLPGKGLLSPATCVCESVGGGRQQLIVRSLDSSTSVTITIEPPDS